MNSRLARLREQRDLILKHLQWIDQEIAVEDSTESPKKPEVPASDQPKPVESPTTDVIPAPAPTPIASGEMPVPALDPSDEGNVQSLKSDVRKGCLLYFGLAWVLLAAAVAIVYLAYS
jgi:cell division protein FtsN